MLRIEMIFLYLFAATIFMGMGAAIVLPTGRFDEFMEMFNMIFPAVAGMTGLVLGIVMARDR
jgi:hypothetical protein